MNAQGYAIDFHVHTKYSFDSIMPPKLVIELARRRGLDGVAIVDHDTIAGALATIEANRYSDFTVIPGIEIKSDLGDVIALYVHRDVRSRAFADVIAEIHEQGGLAYVPHPVRTFGPNLPQIHARHPQVDLWELYNGRYEGRDFCEAQNVFRALGIEGALCGSDAHNPWEIGALRTLLPGLPSDRQSLLDICKSARLNAAPRGEFGLRAGIVLGALTKAWKRKQYDKVAQMVGELPLKALRRSMRIGLERLRG